MRSRTTWLVFVALAAFACLLTAGAATGAKTKKPKLGKHDHALLAQKRAQGEDTVTLLIATRDGSAAQAAGEIEALGGRIEKRDDQLGYLRVSVPLEKAVAVSKLDSIDAADVDEKLPLPAPRLDEEGSPAVDPPGATTPSQNAYMPTKDIGAPQFVAANPTWDGRGVVVAVVDSGVDLLTPELQSAKDTNGRTVRKVVDWVSAMDPVGDDDPSWLLMETKVTAVGGSFTWGGATYTAPAGTQTQFFINSIAENDLAVGTSEFVACGGTGADLDRDGTCGESFAAIWDGDQKVWVDTDGDRASPTRRRWSRYRAGTRTFGVGTNRASTPQRDTVPFVVQIAKPRTSTSGS